MRMRRYRTRRSPVRARLAPSLEQAVCADRLRFRPMTSAVPEAATVLSELEAANRLLVQQVLKPIANEYRISIPTPGSREEGRPLLYVKQKKMKIKEDIRFRLSPDDGE